MGSFEEAVNKFGDKTVERIQLSQKMAVLEIGQRVIMRTPVGNMSLWKHPKKGYVGGHLRANWQFSKNKPASNEIDTTDTARANRSMGQCAANIGKGEDAKIFITNCTPYAERVEMGHWSKQAPAGMVGITVAEFDGIISKVVRETK